MFAKCVILLFACATQSIWSVELTYSPDEILYIAHDAGGVSRFQLATRSLSKVIDLKGPVTIEYDNKHNCLFYATRYEIRRRCFAASNSNASSADEIIYVDLSQSVQIERLAYDWISDNLYFVDSLNSRIELLRLQYDEHRAAEKHHVQTNIHKFGLDRKLSGIAVNPIKGYLFWTEVSFVRPSIWRSNLDGTNIQILTEKPYVHRPLSIAIDYEIDYVYWTDMERSNIARCDYKGDGIEDVSRKAAAMGLAIYRGLMIWTSHFDDAVMTLNKGEC